MAKMNLSLFKTEMDAVSYPDARSATKVDGGWVCLNSDGRWCDRKGVLAPDWVPNIAPEVKLPRRREEFLRGFLENLLKEAPKLNTGSLPEWKKAVSGFEFDLSVTKGESRAFKNMQTAGLVRYLEPRGESMGMAFSESGAEVLFNLHKKRSAGRPKTMEEGREIKLWLDEKTIEEARKKGSGSISAGIRMAFGELYGIGKLMQAGYL